ncbi:MAG: tRNA uridine(34) 5-carboxymethylaminomethyl modification radical SAM/GNAT enzyme Elp3 [Candidatus Kariarchaeaceae archaeon]
MPDNTSPSNPLLLLKDLLLAESNPTPKSVELLKRQICSQFSLPGYPRNSEILALASSEERPLLVDLLRIRRVRTISGVAVIAVMMKPVPCDHGICIMCPGGPSKDDATPQSYTGLEPAARRGHDFNYDPSKQTSHRLNQLFQIGHSTDKIDLIIMGGTFHAYPKEYRINFIKGCFDALNGSVSETLAEAHLINETSEHRCIGLTIETRPDYCTPDQLKEALNSGITRAEIGVQSTFDEVLMSINRGHGMAEVYAAFKNLKDSGLKVTAHMMPGLPGSSFEKDIEAFKKLYEDPHLIPDEIKLYPTQVMPGTVLEEMYNAGEYEALTNDGTAELMARIKMITPPFVRIKRALRDLPTEMVIAGPNKGNMRQIAKQLLHKEGKRCRCIRCREVGHRIRDDDVYPDPDKISLVEIKMNASDGVDYFLSFEDIENDVLIGFLRLRKPSTEVFIQELKGNCWIIRELHVYGAALPIGDSADTENKWQHRGFGRKLIERAEEIARENRAEKIAVISGVGVRQYYYNRGYERDGPYCSKELSYD